jgi:Uncharacterised protein family (UPF0175).
MSKAAIDIKRTAAVKYFKESKLSLGQCAELAEMSEELFINYLSEQSVSIFKFENDEDILEDIDNAFMKIANEQEEH